MQKGVDIILVMWYYNYRDKERGLPIMKRYEVWVFGQDFDHLENDGGWQLCFTSFNEQEARDFAIICEISYGDDNVDFR